jgi:hypothetical protein
MMRKLHARDQTRNRFRPQSSARAVSVYDGRFCLGSITVNEAGVAHAFDSNGTQLGTFPILKDALAAFPVSASEGPCHD